MNEIGKSLKFMGYPVFLKMQYSAKLTSKNRINSISVTQEPKR